ncbi:MAG TPA: DUF475 domain-containing protein [Candidatus Saccharimonadales bacterium]|nr:DUF475 domain-containing protein [Candidatus Saccharimonadales bacterium]
MKMFLRMFGFSSVSTVAVIAAVMYFLGFSALLPLIILMIIEITFSFDNAVINAKILKKLSPLWQQLFLTVGIVIAIFGMRLVFPVLIVSLTAGIGWKEVIDLALHHPQEYAHHLEHAGPSITAFGGAFLLMLSLQFFMEQEKEHHWFKRFELGLQKFGSFWWVPSAISAAVVAIFAFVPLNHHGGETVRSGLVGVAAYLAIHGLTVLIGRTTENAEKLKHYTGWLAFTMFMYLQLLDASLSLDGVLGAFAITSDVVLIVAGLGVGAVWVRSLTVYMVRRGTLESYKYLEHGAHYAIAVLAFSMLFDAIYVVPEAVTGLLGVALIAGSIASSVKLKNSTAKA